MVQDPVRLQKIMASAGLCSRREAENWIRLGFVTVNGQKAKIGDQAIPAKDHIKIRGKLLNPQLAKSQTASYFAFNKPSAVLSVLRDDDQGRKTLKPFVKDMGSFVFPVNKLEFNTEGLMLFTNDGDLMAKLQETKGLLRTYEAKIKGHFGPEEIKNLQKPAPVGDRLVRPLAVFLKQKLKSKTQIEIVFKGPGHHEVREFLNVKRLRVERLILTKIGHISLGALPPGGWKTLKKSSFEALIQQPELAEIEFKKREA